MTIDSTEVGCDVVEVAHKAKCKPVRSHNGVPHCGAIKFPLALYHGGLPYCGMVEYTVAHHHCGLPYCGTDE